MYCNPGAQSHQALPDQISYPSASLIVAHLGTPDDRCEATGAESGTGSVSVDLLIAAGGTNPFCIAVFVLESGRAIRFVLVLDFRAA